MKSSHSNLRPVEHSPIHAEDHVDRDTSQTESHDLPTAPLPQLFSPAKSHKSFYDESLLQPHIASPQNVFPAVNNYQDTTLNKNDLCNMVGLSGSGLGQEIPWASGTMGSTIANALTEGSGHECSCIACLSVGALKDWPDHGMSCRFPDCSYFTKGHSDHILHERGHFQQAGFATFRCVEQVCLFTSKRWPDLVRHYTVKHCTSPTKFRYPCPVIWCKYSGNNGFARKDKLKSHYKNVHEGKPGPVKAGRVIKPATLKPQVCSSGSKTGTQKE